MIVARFSLKTSFTDCYWTYRYHFSVKFSFFFLKATKNDKTTLYSILAQKHVGQHCQQQSYNLIILVKQRQNNNYNTSGKLLPADRLYIFTLLGSETCIFIDFHQIFECNFFSPCKRPCWILV